jgi:hypothetical protein
MPSASTRNSHRYHAATSYRAGEPTSSVMPLLRLARWMRVHIDQAGITATPTPSIVRSTARYNPPRGAISAPLSKTTSLSPKAMSCVSAAGS